MATVSSKKGAACSGCLSKPFVSSAPSSSSLGSKKKKKNKFSTGIQINNLMNKYHKSSDVLNSKITGLVVWSSKKLHFVDKEAHNGKYKDCNAFMELENEGKETRDSSNARPARRSYKPTPRLTSAGLCTCQSASPSH